MTRLEFWYEISQGGAHTAESPAEIDAALDRVADLGVGIAIAVQIARENDEATILMAGLNGEVGTLHYGEDGSAYFSEGVGAADGESLIYGWEGHEYTFPPNAEIPIADVRAAVHEYARTGSRPTGVRWQREAELEFEFDPATYDNPLTRALREG